jgi:O-antigen/teichoic acid export membrane protein
VSRSLPARSVVAEGEWPRWLKLLGRHALVQALCQLLGILCGVLIVRALPVAQYASYTLVFAFMATATLLADSGTTNAVSAIGGRVHADTERMARLVTTVMRFRGRLEAILFLGVLPLLALMLHAEGEGPFAIALSVLLAAVSIHAQVASAVMLVVLRLQLRLEELQRVQLLAVVLRLLLTLGALSIVRRFEWVLLASASSALVERLLFERQVYARLSRSAPEEAADHRAVRTAFRHQFISAAYVAFQSQITIWLLSLFGGKSSIAEIGALGRLGVIFGVISAVLSNVIFPRFARYTDAVQLRQRYFQTLAGVALSGLAMVVLVLLLPRPVLWVLGQPYLHLERELAWMVGSSVCYLLTNTIWGLNASRGWVRGSWLYAPLTLATQLVLFWTMDVSSVGAAILFGWYSLVPAFLINAVLSFRGFKGLGGLALGTGG